MSENINRYYWCVNCGFHGDFKKHRVRNIQCEKCNYTDLHMLDESEWEKYGKKRHEKQIEDEYYQPKRKK